MPGFTLELNEDQQTLQKWLHEFSENVIRPAAHEWDEREETPWPILQEAAKIGLYGFEFLVNTWSDATGLSLPIAIGSLAAADAGVLQLKPAEKADAATRLLREAWIGS